MDVPARETPKRPGATDLIPPCKGSEQSGTATLIAPDERMGKARGGHSRVRAPWSYLNFRNPNSALRRSYILLSIRCQYSLMCLSCAQSRQKYQSIGNHPIGVRLSAGTTFLQCLQGGFFSGRFSQYI